MNGGLFQGAIPLAFASQTIVIGVSVLVNVLLLVWLLVRRKEEVENRETGEELMKKTRDEAELIKQKADLEAENIIKEARIKAKEEVISSRDEFEASTRQRRKELQKLEERLTAKEDNVDKKQAQLDSRLEALEARDRKLHQEQENLKEKMEQLQARSEQQIAELERVASMSQDEARELLLSRLEESLEAERGALIHRFQEENKQHLMEESQTIMVNAMQRYSGDCAYERTTSTIPLPNEDMKGRIIGREGRNIRTIEMATGASLLVDDTPQAVVVSCFDPLRKEVARRTLEKLVQDGRIHPGRVEDMVEKTRKEVDSEVQKAGQETLDKLNVLRVKPNLVTLLGRLKFRYSFSQNVLAHSVEVASLAGSIAASMGLDEAKARRAGLFHDIGKAVDHEVEGTHAMIGADLLKRAGEDDEIVNAVAAHHEETEKTSLLAILVQICDTLSASRPGARSETTELYLKRLEQLETIGNSFDGVENCFAIQAGRELRVIVQPEKISEDRAAILAHDMAERIEKEMRYPGQVRVSIIRETRAVDYAK